MKKLNMFLYLVLAIILAVTAGCGGSSGGPSGDTAIPPGGVIPSLKMGTPAVSGGIATFPLTLSGSANSSISGIEADISFNAGELTLIMNGSQTTSAAPGAAASGAGKQIGQSVPKSDVLHIVVYGLNTTAIADGVVAQVSFNIMSGANAATAIIKVLQPAATDPGGAAVTIVGTP